MNLSVQYLGCKFPHPFVLASAPPTANGEMIARAFEAGWAGAVVKTLIREPVRNLHNRFASNRIGGRVLGFENIELLSELSPAEWFRDMRALKQSYPDRILIGSIMGDAADKAPWVDLALGCQESGADLLELNFSCPHGYPEKGQGAAIGQNPDYSARITAWVKEETRLTIPVVPKLTAAVTDISHIGEAVARAGADGLSAINTIPCIMGFDLDTLEPRPSVRGYSSPGGYSGPGIKPMALRCIGELMQCPGLPVMACGGISSGADSAEFLLMGAPVLQVCTAVMLKGYRVLDRLREGLEAFMARHGFDAIDTFLGRGFARIRAFHDLDIDYRVCARIDPEACNVCRACEVSCRDAGYQAITCEDKTIVVDPVRCQGCSLCVHVCPRDAVHLAECDSP